jgi:5'-3' exonuclease
VIVHLVDGTYELFRHYFAVPPARNAHGEEIGAVRGVVRSIVGMLEGGATHVGVATDHVIESFRNYLYPFYKTSAGVDPVLLSQFEPLEESLRALGVTVWAMVEHEADDALATAARIASADPAVERVIICTPDKDLAQCVEGHRVVQLDRRRRQERDEAGVVERFGVPPGSIPDLLALIGDSADGFPGLPGFGAKTAAAVLSRYGHIEAIPGPAGDWDVPVRGIERLAATLAEKRNEAMLYKDLATLRRDSPGVTGPAESWRWRGPGEGFGPMCARLDDEELPARVGALTARFVR